MLSNLFLIFGAVFFCLSLVSKRIQNTPLTFPILFTATGYGLHTILMEAGGLTYSEGGFHILAEITLILVLAADASQVPLRDLRETRGLALRLLMVSLPLTIILGALAGMLLFPGEPWYLMALIAAILAPTDASLGSAVVSNEAVPKHIRRGLLIESGLNDGIALPAVLFFACFLNLMHQTGEENWLLFLALQLSLGPIVGIAVGWIGGKLLSLAARAGWILETFQGVAAMALAIIAYGAAEAVGGNGFIAAFVCGITYGAFRKQFAAFMHEFTETESQFLTQLTFFLFGALILPEAIQQMNWNMLAYGLVSLTLVRMIPVLLSLLGSDLPYISRWFIGWFGPRGLASILFALLILEELEVKDADFIQAIVAMTVILSIMLHGLSASPLSKALIKRLDTPSPPA